MALRVDDVDQYSTQLRHTRTTFETCEFERWPRCFADRIQKPTRTKLPTRPAGRNVVACPSVHDDSVSRAAAKVSIEAQELLAELHARRRRHESVSAALAESRRVTLDHI
jgi:hypothetical protein